MTRILIIVFVTGLWTIDSFGQGNPCDSVHTIVDQMPIYGKNGNADLYAYIAKNIKFKNPCRPEELRRMIWTINKQGKMVDIDVMGLEGKCKTDIIEQLKKIPNWTPGRLKGDLVCVKMILPIQIHPSY